eukprot:1150394-Pelagomonas_calceolata.AAC.5
MALYRVIHPALSTCVLLMLCSMPPGPHKLPPWYKAGHTRACCPPFGARLGEAKPPVSACSTIIAHVLKSLVERMDSSCFWTVCGAV